MGVSVWYKWPHWVFCASIGVGWPVLDHSRWRLNGRGPWPDSDYLPKLGSPGFGVLCISGLVVAWSHQFRCNPGHRHIWCGIWSMFSRSFIIWMSKLGAGAVNWAVIIIYIVWFVSYRRYTSQDNNYCHIMWHFCGHTNSLKIEKLHKKSINVVLNDYLSPYHVLLEKVKRPTIYVSRMKSIGFEVFKCLHNCSPSHITDMFRISDTPYDTRGGTKLIQTKVNTTWNGLKYFSLSGSQNLERIADIYKEYRACVGI